MLMDCFWIVILQLLYFANCEEAVNPIPKYFVYKEFPFNWFHSNCTVVNSSSKYSSYKHSDDYWFGQAAHRPNAISNNIQRVFEPEKATIYIVPALLNLISASTKNRGFKIFCCYDICDENLIEKLNIALISSPWYRKNNGLDHLIVASHFFTKNYLKNAKAISSCAHITFERPSLAFSNDRKYRKLNMGVSIPSQYVGIQCNFNNNNNNNNNNYNYNNMIDYNNIDGIHLLGQIDHRGAYSERRYICDAIGQTNDLRLHSYCASSSSTKYSIYGENICSDDNYVTCTLDKNNIKANFYCDSIKNTPFIIHSRGDTFGSSRLMDAITNGAIPIFTHPEQYAILPFSRTVLWQSMSVIMRKAPSSNTTETILLIREALDEISNRKEEIIENIKKYKALVTWNTEGSQVFDTYLTFFYRDYMIEKNILGF